MGAEYMGTSLSSVARGTPRHQVQLTQSKMVVVTVLVSLVVAAAAQETPLWFLETTLTGSFKERSATCKGLLGDRAEEASVGPIFIPENHQQISASGSLPGILSPRPGGTTEE